MNKTRHETLDKLQEDAQELGMYSPYHVWGEQDFDWDALNAAMRYIKRRVAQMGGYVSMKEKYGTIRYEFWCAPGFTLGITGRYRILKWLGRKWINTSLYRFWVRCAEKRTVKAAYEAAKKWPQVADEILDEIEWI